MFGMDSNADTVIQSDNFARDLAILNWMIELGADEAICENPINRNALPKAAPVLAKPDIKPDQPRRKTAPVQPMADNVAQSCNDLESLRNAIAQFDGCALKKGARKMVFGTGNPDARVMIIGECPSRAEDQSGQPFAGQTGVLLDKMLAAINLSTDAKMPENAAYLANIIPWRAPQNREASPDEISMMLPFLMRHIQLIKPDFLVLMGNSASKTLLEANQSIGKIRGQWGSVLDIPTLPMFHPGYLMRSAAQKRAAWADLLSLKQKISGKIP